MAVRVLALQRAEGSPWNWKLPPTQGGFQYYMTGAFIADQNTASVPTALHDGGTEAVLTELEVQKMFEAMQQQIDSLKQEIKELKDCATGP